MRDVYVAVIGAGAGDRGAERIAEEVGRLLARRGAVVVCGGLGGVMEAVCRGARGEEGRTVALLPDEDRSRANPYVDIAIATGMGEMRNALIVRSADAVIAVGGEFGTLSEIGFALKIGKPVVGIATWELAKSGRASDAIVRAASADEAVDLALKLAAG